MSNSKWRKILSLVLVLVLIFQMMPVSAFADDDVVIIGSDTADYDLTADEQQEVYVTNEVTELRGEREKHFRLSDGSFVVMEYEQPIHYQEADGSWEEIDNALLLTGESYTAQVGGVEKHFAASMSEDYLLSLDYDGYGLELSLLEPGETAAEPDPGIADIQPIEEPIETEETTLPSDEPAQEDSEASDSIIIITDDEEVEPPVEEGGIIVISDVVIIDGDGSSTEVPSEEDVIIIGDENTEPDEEPAETEENAEPDASEAVVTETGYQLVRRSDITAQIQNTEAASALSADNTLLSLEEAAEVRNFGSQVAYSSVFPGVSLVYQNLGYDVKESIIVAHPLESYSFAFRLNLAGLTAFLEEDGSVSLKNSSGELIYLIPAPYMFDADGEQSSAVSYGLTETSAGYILTVTADSTWLNAAERAFPVTIDPSVTFGAYTQSDGMTANYVTGKYPSQPSGTHQLLYVGYTNDMTEAQIFAGFDSIPTIPGNCTLVKAELQMTQTAYSPYSGSLKDFGAYAVTGAIPSGTTYKNWINNLSWNTRPEVSASVADYVSVNYSTINKNFKWDITRIVKNWYADSSATRALCIKLVNPYKEDGSRNVGRANFPGYGGQYAATVTPYLYVYYRQEVGLEDYYTAQSHSIDRAGTGYVSDFTANLTLVKNDVSAASTSVPVSISHVYNSAYASGQISAVVSGASGYSSMHLGKGWKLDIQQAVSVYNDNCLQYLDADGTIHYFYRSSTSSSTYTDEDGLGLTITASSGNYTMTDRYGNTSYFGSGLLSYTQDANGNKITYVRNSSNQVTSVTRTPSGGSAETVATLAYNSSGYLSSITDMAGNMTTFTYSSNNLTQVMHPDGTTVSYTYNSAGKLLTAKDNESDYSMTYTYNSQGKVSSFTEKAGSTTGASVSVTGGSEVRSYRYCGKDRTLNNSDDLITTYVFDHSGRTITSATTSADGRLIYGASAASYSSNSGTLSTNNRLLVGSDVGMRPVGSTGSYTFTNGNLLTNGDMSGSSGWSGGSYVTDSKFGRAIQLTGATGTEKSISQTVTVNSAASQTYILSAWAKASSVALKDEARTYTLQATLTYSGGATETQKVNFCADSTEWQYNVLPIVPTKSGTVASIKVEFTFNSNPNTALFTYACLTKETAASYKYNSNGDLVSVSTPQNATQTYSYSGADLISQVTKGNGTYTYEYDSKHNVTKATNDGVSMSISYDAKGNTTGTTLTGTNTSDKITSSAAYDSTGNYVSSQTDARGNTVTYAYGNNISKMTGQPTAVTDPTNVTRTSSYNTANGRITGTEITGTASLDYIYGSGRLTTMTRSGYVPGDTAEQPQTYTMSYDGFGNMTGVSVGNKSLATYTYSGNNGQLSQMSYGNGDSVSYSYDNLERVQNVYYNGSSSPALTYSYKGEGTLGSLTDSVNNRTYSYTYDSLGRLSAMMEKSGSTSVQTYNASYDTANRLTGYNYQLSPAWDGTLGSTRTYGYTYKASDGSLSSMTAPGGSYAYNYDGLKRLSSRVLTVGGATLINRQFGYLAGTGTNGTTLLVSSLTNKNASGGTISQYNYTYDALGNITAISGSTSASYTYDDQSQLLTETVGGVTYTYTYDTYGNLRSKTDGTTTDTYTYGDSQWLDLLTAYNGNTISYDAIGNPTTWYDGTTFTWANGRRLASATNTDEGLTASYTYDSDGLRLTKTVGGVEHKYLWQGSKLVSEYYGGKELEFFYDESGNPYAFSYKASSTATPVTYYYLTNLQGDITGILDSSGTCVATYTYNAWGKLLSSTGDLASINPLRYRGYYYDAETELYYVSSRYYDPEIGRWINADSYHSTGQGIIGNNMFAYCLNNPVNYYDSDGSFAIAIPLIALGKILFDGCVSLLAIAAVWEIGCTIGEGISALRQDANISSTTINSAYASSQDKVSKRVEESFSKAASLPSTSHNDELHHLVAKRAPNASYARQVLAEVGININSGENLMLIKYGLHRRLHTDTYYGWANSVVISAYRGAGGNPALQAQQVRLALGTIRAFLSVLNDAAPF